VETNELKIFVLHLLPDPAAFCAGEEGGVLAQSVRRKFYAGKTDLAGVVAGVGERRLLEDLVAYRKTKIGCHAPFSVAALRIALALNEFGKKSPGRRALGFFAEPTVKSWIAFA
jgi:hypothetical protein